MRLIFLGPPGAGKGTQSKFVCDKFNIPQISTGDILRDAVKNGTEMGIKAKSFMDAGKLVPDEVVIGIVKDRLKEKDTINGYILDGFPRTSEQATALDQMLQTLNQKLDYVLYFNVPENELMKRLLGRAKELGRSDDTSEVIKVRIDTYNDKTLPILDFYRNKNILKEINGTESITEINNQLLKILK